ncbi:MAG: 2Fe-2S iron-sulfur cluster-binding protein [Salaquimonas sp.]
MERSLRIITGLVLYLFIATHLLNVATGVIDPVLIEELRPVFLYVWSSRIGGIFLLLCLIIHMIAGFRTLYYRNTLQMSVSDTVQFASAFLVPPLLIPHVWGVIAMEQVLGVEPTYLVLMQFFWIDNPLEGLRQVFLIVVVWVHGSIGIFIWLRLKPWWGRAAPMVYPLIVLIPILAMLGFVSGGNLAISQGETALDSYEQSYATDDAASSDEISAEEIAANNRAAEQFAADYEFVVWVKWLCILIYSLILAAVLIARYVRLAGKAGQVSIRYDDGTLVQSNVGLTFLELSHLNAIPHANLCRGRGRCGTCRIKILETTAVLPNPSEMELATLEFTHSAKDVRLACQCVPGAGEISIERLMQADISHNELKAQSVKPKTNVPGEPVMGVAE